MKYISLLIVAVAFLLGSCRHNDEPPSEVQITIIEEYLPRTIRFDRSDQEFRNEAISWNNRIIEVNSPDDLPDDPLGFDNLYSKINFKNYTLLLRYEVYNWNIESNSNLFIKNNRENTYDWILIQGVTNYDNEDRDILNLTRFAIKVRKLPAGAVVCSWRNITDLDFDWEN